MTVFHSGNSEKIVNLYNDCLLINYSFSKLLQLTKFDL
jgi:hypothetical protein